MLKGTTVTVNAAAPLPSKPMIAICTATRSKPNWRSLDNTTLQKLFIPSILHTVSAEDRGKYDFRLYLAADDDDPFWLTNQKKNPNARLACSTHWILSWAQA